VGFSWYTSKVKLNQKIGAMFTNRALSIFHLRRLFCVFL